MTVMHISGCAYLYQKVDINIRPYLKRLFSTMETQKEKNLTIYCII